jgi:hypothetical protein
MKVHPDLTALDRLKSKAPMPLPDARRRRGLSTTYVRVPLELKPRLMRASPGRTKQRTTPRTYLCWSLCG